MKYSSYLLKLIAILAILNSCQSKSSKNEKDMAPQLKEFISKYEKKVKPVVKEMTTAYFTASVSGKSEDYQKAADAELKLSQILSDTNDFNLLKEIKKSGSIEDPELKRQLDIIYNTYLAKQIPEWQLREMIQLQNEIEQKYNTFRALVHGDTLTDNDIESVLKTEKDNDKLKATWLAHKKVGNVVAIDIIRLVKLRNKVARSLGFENYHQMSLKLSDQNPEDVDKLFDELDRLTKSSYANLKNELDNHLANRYQIDVSELMPWHYQNRFFQEAPAIYDVDLNQYYENQDIEQLTIQYYESIGMDINDIIQNSDLYEKPGKNQHAFCISIDKSGDIRILCNIKPNYNWMNTMLHEFGHGVYEKYINHKVPYALRDPAHIFTTEAVAQFFGRLAASPEWMYEMELIPAETRDSIKEECYKTLRLDQLVFSRWSQVMYHFEKALYEDPEQDLNQLWWELVEQYQMIKKPEGRDEPDWATKIHIATSPCYYHNYLLGELLASQFYYHIGQEVLNSDDISKLSYAGTKKIGNYFIEKVFEPGAKFYWNDMIEKATGEKLTAKYYAKQFVK